MNTPRLSLWLAAALCLLASTDPNAVVGEKNKDGVVISRDEGKGHGNPGGQVNQENPDISNHERLDNSGTGTQTDDMTHTEVVPTDGNPDGTLPPVNAGSNLIKRDLDLWKKFQAALKEKKAQWMLDGLTEAEVGEMRAFYGKWIKFFKSPQFISTLEAELEKVRPTAVPEVVVPTQGNTAGTTNPQRLPKTDGTANGGNANPVPEPFIPDPGWLFRREVTQSHMDRDPNDPWGYSADGQERVMMGDYRGGRASLDKAISLGATDAKTFSAYGVAAYQLGDYAAAREAAAKALKIDPNDGSAHSVMMLTEGRVSGAEPSAMAGAQALGETFSGGGSEVPLGSISARTGPAGPAPGQKGPGFLKSAAAAKEAAEALGVRDFMKAIEAASRAISANENNAQAWNYRAIANNKVDRFRDAVRDASFALRLAPGNTTALHTRAYALNKMGKYQEALADADSVLEREPRNSYAYQNRAFALAGLGDRAGMRESLRRSADIDPRFKSRYEQALQVPDSGDVLFLFDEGGGAKAAPAAAAGQPARRKRLGSAALALSGGLLFALGLLHVVSASWREKVRSTVRRMLGGAASGAASAEETPVEPGAFWTKYRMVREVGLGGMGVVYEGLDTALERRVAIKKMRDEIRLDRRERDRFLQEARTVASLRHPNIVEIYSIVEDGGEVYLVFEFATGKTLAMMLEEAGSLPFETARRILREACEAVEYAHRHKVIHRDLKPSNIMVTEEGTAKVMDFGVARQAKDAATKVMTNTVVGTPPYMAPEQEQGTVRPESDVYALGIVLYEMLCGKLPFPGIGAGMLLNKLNGRFAPLTSVSTQALPAGIDDVFARVLSPDPARRYRSAAEFAAALDGLRPGGPAA